LRNARYARATNYPVRVNGFSVLNWEGLSAGDAGGARAQVRSIAETFITTILLPSTLSILLISTVKGVGDGRRLERWLLGALCSSNSVPADAGQMLAWTKQ